MASEKATLIKAMKGKRWTVEQQKAVIPKHFWVGSSDFLVSIVSGLGALTSFADPPLRIEYPHSSATDALRGDWLRIGQDMKTVIERENGPQLKETA